MRITDKTALSFQVKRKKKVNKAEDKQKCKC